MMNAVGLYILDGKQPVSCEDIWAWNEWMANNRRHVAVTKCNHVRVSTIFLGLDHNYHPDGPPLLFETMIFGGELTQHLRRYCTWEEAEAGHAETVAEVMAHL